VFNENGALVVQGQAFAEDLLLVDVAPSSPAQSIMR
jgi:hypothetical protein